MKKPSTLINILVVVLLLGIFAALLIPNAITPTPARNLLKEKTKDFYTISNYTAELIENANIPEEEKLLYISYLDKLILDIKKLPRPKTKPEFKEQISRLSKEVAILQEPNEWIKKINNKETITSDPMFNIYLDLYKIGAKVDFLYKEKLTRWDVAIVLFLILGGLGTIVAIITFMIKISNRLPEASPEADSKRQPRLKNQKDK